MLLYAGAVLVWGPKRDPNLENYPTGHNHRSALDLCVDEHVCFQSLGRKCQDCKPLRRGNCQNHASSGVPTTTQTHPKHGSRVHLAEGLHNTAWTRLAEIRTLCLGFGVSYPEQYPNLHLIATLHMRGAVALKQACQLKEEIVQSATRLSLGVHVPYWYIARQTTGLLLRPKNILFGHMDP